MNSHIKLIISYLFIIFSSQLILANDYFCDPVNGNMNNNGSQEKPWGSLQLVFEKGIEFKPGDMIFLLSGQHGNIKVMSQNEKYIKVTAAEGHNPEINTIVFGSEKDIASKWIFSNIIFTGAKNNKTAYIHSKSNKIRLLQNNFNSKEFTHTAITIDGHLCKVESNTIANFENGIHVSGQKNQIRNNRIEFFHKAGIKIRGSNNVFEYNLITESIAKDTIANIGLHLDNKTIQGTIVRGNTIINFTNPSRNHIGLLIGVFANNIQLSGCIFENNSIVSNHIKGISIHGEINNIKVANNTVINPYFGLKFNKSGEINTPNTIEVIGINNSENILIGNNLSNDIILKNIKGFADHNLTIPVDVHEFDLCFNNWALFDFSLNTNSPALNTGSPEIAPKLDAFLNKRPLGNFVNIGAFEFTKIKESNEVITITAEKSDRQLHSKGKGDWDGQSKIKLGGVGEGIDGAGVFPFKLPHIAPGKKIISANFHTYLSKIDNQPTGGIDLYGLPSKSDFWVTENMFYQETYGQDLLARAIQHNYITPNTYTGGISATEIGQVGLKDYLNSIIESGGKAGEYIFLRLNPNETDIDDFNRWNLESANSSEPKKHPTLEIMIGYPEFNKEAISDITNTIICTPNPLIKGNINFYLIGTNLDKDVHLKLSDLTGKVVYETILNNTNVTENLYRTKGLNLTTGKYIFEFTIDSQTQKRIVFIR